VRIGDPLRELVAERARSRCEYCYYPEEFSPSSFEVEHIKSRSAGGVTRLYNLAFACSHCNAHKARKQNGVDPVTKNTVRFFNPRTNSWSRHFEIDRMTGKIEGLTPIGRATVDVLCMNYDQPLAARRNLIRLEVL